TLMVEMAKSGAVQDIDSDYRPGMPELQIFPDREKLALVGVPVGRVADTMSLLVGGQRVGKFTDSGRRYDIRVMLQLPQRSSPNDLDPLNVSTNSGTLVPVMDVARTKTVATLPVINRYNHQRKIEITASPAAGISQGEAIAKCQQIAERVLPPSEFNIVELGNAQAMHETISSLVF